MATTTLQITGMSCQHCVRAVENALKDVHGVQHVTVTLEPGSARIDHDENVKPHQLVEAVREEGYDAS